MNKERLMTVLLEPHVSEKATAAAEGNQVVFRVRTDADKAEIRQAVELMFEVKVDDVQVVRVKGKTKGSTSARRWGILNSEDDQKPDERRDDRPERCVL